MIDANKFHGDSKENSGSREDKSLGFHEPKGMHLSTYLKEAGVKLKVALSCLTNFPKGGSHLRELWLGLCLC